MKVSQPTIARSLFGIILAAVFGIIVSWLGSDYHLAKPNLAFGADPQESLDRSIKSGEIRIAATTDGLWSIAAKDVPLGAILRRFADAANFSLHAGSLRNDGLSLQLHRQTLDQALRELLHGYPYRPTYRYDSNSAIHHLVDLEAGTLEHTAVAKSPPPASAIDPAEQSAATPPSQSDPSLQQEAELLMAEHLRNELTPAAADAKTLAGSAEQRASAVASMLPAGEDLKRLIGSLQSDPDPLVRAAAAKQLAHGNRRSASNELLAALKDENGTVAIAALSSLVQFGDPSMGTKIRQAAQLQTDEDIRNSLLATADSLSSGARTVADGPTESGDAAP
jgi:hypothetical protein